MKDILIACAVMVLLVGGIWLGVSAYLKPAPGHAASDSQDPPAPPAPAKAAVKRANLQPVAAIPAEAPEIPPQLLEEPIPLMAPPKPGEAALPAPREIPASILNQIAAGMDVEQVVEILGPPTLHTLTHQRGSLNEAYVYKRRTGAAQVVIHVSDGKVVNP